MADEVQNLILQVKGKQDAEALRAALEAEETTLRELNEVLRQNGSLTAAQAAQQKMTATAMVQHQAELKKLQGSFAGLAGSGTRMNSTIQQLGYGLGDLMQASGGLGQKLMSVTNNIQFALAGFGAWGIAAGVALTVVASVVRNFEDEFKNFGGAVDDSKGKLDQLLARIKVLEDKHPKLSVDYTELEQAKERVDELNRAMKAYEEWKHLTTDYEKKSGAEIKGLLANAPGGAAESERKLYEQEVEDIGKATAAARNELKQQTKEAKRSLEEAETMPVPAGADRSGMVAMARAQYDKAKQAAEAYDAQLKEKAKANVGLMRVGAEEGNQQAQQELANRLRRSGQGVLAKRIEQTSAAALRADEEREREDTQKAENWEKAEAMRRAQKEFHLAVPEWQAMSPERRRSFQGATEAERFRAFGEARAAGVMAEPEQPGVLPFKPSAREHEIARTPAEQEAYDAQQREINRQGQAKPLFRPPSPDAEAQDKARSEAMRSQQALAVSPEAQRLLAVVQGFNEGVVAATARHNQLYEQLGAMFGMTAAQVRQLEANARATQGGMMGMGYGGPFGGYLGD